MQRSCFWLRGAPHDRQRPEAGTAVTDGQPKLRIVEVGLMDVSFAQIVSGLEPGEMVTTGLAEVK